MPIAAARSEAPPALAVRGLGKRFPGVTALDQVSFEIRPGEVHALVGQNGAGKSTLINIVSGMLGADAGEIDIAGRPVAIADTRAAIAAGIATVYQELSLLPNLTVAQNIALGREPRRRGLLDVGAMRRRAGAVLDRMGLSIPAETRVGLLSLAERQLIEIAKALSSDPSLLILDEPTAPLGKADCDRLFAAVRRLRDGGIAILYVSHRFAEVLHLCDRVTVLRNGRTVVTAPLAGWTEARLTEMMIGRRTEAFGRTPAEAPGPERLVAKQLRWRDRVRGVDLALHAGEIVVLTGLLGAGQNEIARLLGADLVPDDGTILLDGVARAFDHPAEAVEAGICLLTDDRKREGLLPHLSLNHNIALPSLAPPLTVAGFVNAARERKATEAAAQRFGVVARSLQAPILTLSGGNQQKALLARWDMAQAEVFVLIEPTRGVDVGARAEIYRRLDVLARNGKAILVVSSDLPEVLALADRILVVDRGRIAAETRPAAIDEDRLNLLVQGAA